MPAFTLGNVPVCCWGMMGELHPRVKANYDLRESPLIAAELAVAPLLVARPSAVEVRTIKAFPPVYEDLAVVVDEGVSAEEVVRVIREAGGALEATRSDLGRRAWPTRWSTRPRIAPSPMKKWPRSGPGSSNSWNQR